jgi:hypothetical protein
MSFFCPGSGRLISTLIALFSVLPSHANTCPIGYDGVSAKTRQKIYAGWQGEQLNLCEFNMPALIARHNDKSVGRCGTVIISMRFIDGYIGILPTNSDKFSVFRQDYSDDITNPRRIDTFDPITNKNKRTADQTFYYQSNLTPKVFVRRIITETETDCKASPKF